MLIPAICSCLLYQPGHVIIEAESPVVINRTPGFNVSSKTFLGDGPAACFFEERSHLLNGQCRQFYRIFHNSAFLFKIKLAMRRYPCQCMRQTSKALNINLLQQEKEK
nr:MAG TPA: hypothetical protein [Caudoviricetes sp.]